MGCNAVLTSFLLGWQRLIAQVLAPDSDPEMVEESLTHLRLRDVSVTAINAALLHRKKKFNKHKGFVRACCFSKDSAVCVTVSGDTTALLWETATGYLLHEVYYTNL